MNCTVRGRQPLVTLTYCTISLHFLSEDGAECAAAKAVQPSCLFHARLVSLSYRSHVASSPHPHLLARHQMYSAAPVECKVVSPLAGVKNGAAYPSGLG